MKISAAIAAEVRAQIAARGWSQEQAQEAFGLAPPVFDGYFADETGDGVASMGWDEFCHVATALGHSPSELVRLVEERAAADGSAPTSSART